MRSGFTLVELLVVLVILVLLVILSYFPTATARKKANLIAGQSYVRNVVLALELSGTPPQEPSPLTPPIAWTALGNA